MIRLRQRCASCATVESQCAIRPPTSRQHWTRCTAVSDLPGSHAPKPWPRLFALSHANTPITLFCMEGPQTRALADHLNELITGKPVEQILVPEHRWQANMLLLNCVGQVIQRVRSHGK